ncbi:hypothetical protein GOP47_0018426 [Adiantum capillus-veneris]|uniref:Uncharacterized protein n=1 Tax=Adiantum capillus-veneris TaxID=13818 RepID=A0A9D4UDR8_ADICA|nr:hypothetical protein GOP47_0018426 [Adiantum capillus-veneris]
MMLLKASIKLELQRARLHRMHYARGTENFPTTGAADDKLENTKQGTFTTELACIVCKKPKPGNVQPSFGVSKFEKPSCSKCEL